MIATATIVIVTKNRKDDLCRALESCLRQKGNPEILVIDDGSTDGTEEFVCQRYPTARFIRHETSRGYIARRNEAAKKATGDLIVSIDDDAEFSEPFIVEAVVSQMADSNVAVLALPFIDVKKDLTVRQLAPDDVNTWIASEFIGTAHALRRQVFLEVGGYRETLFHQGEESDFFIRLLDRGYLVGFGRCAPITHYESASRNVERINVFGQRNLILFAWYNVRFPELLVHLILTIAKGLTWGLRRGVLWYRVKGTLLGVRSMFSEAGSRTPVSRRTYWLYRKLRKQGSIRLEDLAALTEA